MKENESEFNESNFSLFVLIQFGSTSMYIIMNVLYVILLITLQKKLVGIFRLNGENNFINDD